MGSIVNVCPAFITPIALFSGRGNQITKHYVQPYSPASRKRDKVGTYWHSVGHLVLCEITCTKGEINLFDVL